MTRFRSVFTVLLLADLAGLLLAFALGCVLRDWSGGHLPGGFYARLLPFVAIFPSFYCMLGMYSAVPRPPHEELKLLSIGSSAGFATIALLLFLGQKGLVYSRMVLLLSWTGALFLVPFFRHIARRICSRRAWWGYPVLVFAPKERGEEAAALFNRHRACGLVLSGVVTVESIDPGRESEGRQEIRDGFHPGIYLDGGDALTGMRAARERHPQARALILGGSLPVEALQELVLLTSRHFKHVLVGLDTFWLQQFSLRVSSISGGPALALRQNLLDPVRMRVKRVLDLALCALGAGVLLIVIPLIALAIRIDSKGPVFFTQQRLGRNGRSIRVAKFRTMVHDAPQVLAKLLEKDGALRREWERTQKLSDDPRLTRVGRFLRHTSLDELPQVFNVLRGEMSLVGPRPIVEDEIGRYGEAYELYSRVRPGMTGLWQISGRNDLTYQDRVRLDKDYVYNWSVWLDIWIIIKTFPALISGRGAY